MIAKAKAPRALAAVEAAPASALQTPAGQLVATGLSQVLGYQLAQAMVVCNGVFERQVGGPHALRPVEYTILQLIAQNPGCSPVRLAKALSVTKPNITLWVERLVARKLVLRKPSASDKRSQELHATRAGAALADRATQSLQQGEAGVLGLLSPGERCMLTELLHKFACGAAP